MREIKFRAWIKSDKEMFDWQKDFFSDMSPVMGYGTEIDFEGIELMQYTGLKDKNGKEIYEGDKISFYKKIAIVEYNAESAQFMGEYEDPLLYRTKLPPYNWCDCEVIGNIYEETLC